MSKCDFCSFEYPETFLVEHDIAIYESESRKTYMFSTEILPELFPPEMIWHLDRICNKCTKFIGNFFKYQSKIRNRLISENLLDDANGGVNRESLGIRNSQRNLITIKTENYCEDIPTKNLINKSSKDLADKNAANAPTTSKTSCGEKIAPKEKPEQNSREQNIGTCGTSADVIDNTSSPKILEEALDLSIRDKRNYLTESRRATVVRKDIKIGDNEPKQVTGVENEKKTTPVYQSYFEKFTSDYAHASSNRIKTKSTMVAETTVSSFRPSPAEKIPAAVAGSNENQSVGKPKPNKAIEVKTVEKKKESPIALRKETIVNSKSVSLLKNPFGFFNNKSTLVKSSGSTQKPIVRLSDSTRQSNISQNSQTLVTDRITIKKPPKVPILKSFQTNPFRLSSAKKNLGSAIVPSTTLRAFPIIKLEAPSRKQTCYAATKNQEVSNKNTTFVTGTNAKRRKVEEVSPKKNTSLIKAVYKESENPKAPIKQESDGKVSSIKMVRISSSTKFNRSTAAATSETQNLPIENNVITTKTTKKVVVEKTKEVPKANIKPESDDEKSLLIEIFPPSSIESKTVDAAKNTKNRDATNQINISRTNNNKDIGIIEVEMSQIHGDAQALSSLIQRKDESSSSKQIRKSNTARKRTRSPNTSQNPSSLKRLGKRFEKKLDTSIEEGQCSICKKEFRSLQGLKSHILGHHGFEPLNVKQQTKTKENHESQESSSDT